MNKDKIKELMQRAGTDTSCKWMGVDHAEVFAQLIVAECIECADTVGKNNLDSGYPNSTAHHVKQKIKEHFGVEE